LEVSQFFVHLGSALVNAGLLWLFYVALSRASAMLPDIMISWTLSAQRADTRRARRTRRLIGVARGSWCCS
jgi:hypothetical protein